MPLILEEAIYDRRNDPSTSIRLVWIELALLRNKSTNPLSESTRAGLLEKLIDSEERVRSFTLEKLPSTGWYSGSTTEEALIDSSIERMRDVKESVRQAAVSFLSSVFWNHLILSENVQLLIDIRYTRIADELISLCSHTSLLNLRLSYMTLIEPALFIGMTKISSLSTSLSLLRHSKQIQLLSILLNYFIRSSLKNETTSTPFFKYLRNRMIFSKWMQSMRSMLLSHKSTISNEDKILFPLTNLSFKQKFISLSIDLAPDFIKAAYSKEDNNKILASVLELLVDNISDIGTTNDNIFLVLMENSAGDNNKLSILSRRLLKSINILIQGQYFYCPDEKICEFLTLIVEEPECRWLLKNYPLLGSQLLALEDLSMQKRKLQLVQPSLKTVSVCTFATYYQYIKSNSSASHISIKDKKIDSFIENIFTVLLTEKSKYPEISPKLLCCSIRILLSYTRSPNATISCMKVVEKYIELAISQFTKNENFPNVFNASDQIKNNYRHLSLDLLSSVLLHSLSEKIDAPILLRENLTGITKDVLKSLSSSMYHKIEPSFKEVLLTLGF